MVQVISFQVSNIFVSHMKQIVCVYVQLEVNLNLLLSGFIEWIVSDKTKLNENLAHLILPFSIIYLFINVNGCPYNIYLSL
jgi:hypothetical protein